MRNKCVQMSLSDIYNGVSQSMEEHKPELIQLLEEHLDFDSLIPAPFRLECVSKIPELHFRRLDLHFCVRNPCLSPTKAAVFCLEMQANPSETAFLGFRNTL